MHKFPRILLLALVLSLAVAPLAQAATSTFKPAESGSMEIPVGVNSYPEKPNRLLPNAYLNMYKVTPINTSYYEASLMETQSTGPNAGLAKFTVQAGQMVEFVAFLDKDAAYAKTQYVFSSPPYRIFATEDGNKFCQVNRTDTENVMLMEVNAQPSCGESFSYPAVDNPSHKKVEEPKKEKPFNFNVFPESKKLNGLYVSGVKRVRNLERKLNGMVSLLSGEKQKVAAEVVDKTLDNLRATLNAVAKCLELGDRECVFVEMNKFKAAYKEARLLIRRLAELIEQDEDEVSEETLLPQPGQDDVARLEEGFRNFSQECVVDIASMLREAASKVNAVDGPLAKQYVEEWIEVCRRLIEKGEQALAGKIYESLKGTVSALMEHIVRGKQLLRKLQNLAGIEPFYTPFKKPEPKFFPLPMPASTFAIPPEKFGKVFEPIPSGQTDTEGLADRLSIVEKKLYATLESVPEQFRGEMKKHVEQCVGSARNTLMDLNSALSDGNANKAYGLRKAFLAHLQNCLQLEQKLANLGAVQPGTTEPTPTLSITPGGIEMPGPTDYSFGPMNIPVTVNTYPNQNYQREKQVANAYVVMLKVNPVTHTNYQAYAIEVKQTGPNGEAAVFSVEPRLAVAFVAFTDAEKAKGLREHTFAVPPFKHFVTKKAAVFCQTRFTNIEEMLVHQTFGGYSCASGLSVPVGLRADYEGWVPVRENIAVTEKPVEKGKPPVSVDVYPREKVEEMIYGAYQRLVNVEDALRQIVKLFPEDQRDAASKHVEQFISIARGACDDAKVALSHGDLAKAYGKAKECGAHVDRGENLISKLKNLLEENQPKKKSNPNMSCGRSEGEDGVYSGCSEDYITHRTSGIVATVLAYDDKYVTLGLTNADREKIVVQKGTWEYVLSAKGQKVGFFFESTSPRHGAFVEIRTQ